MAKLTKLYGTTPYLNPYNERWPEYLWCDENYVFMATFIYNQEQQFIESELTVYKINSDGSLTQTDQIFMPESIMALYGDGRFLYVGLGGDIFNGFKTYKVETNGTLTFKEAVPTDRWVTSITGDGRFIYVTIMFSGFT